MTTLLVPYAPTSAADVRRALVRELRERAVPEEVVDDAVLVVSELVGNAVRHGAPIAGRQSSDAVRVSWWVAAGAVHLEVCDGGPGPVADAPAPDPMPDPVAESGRGLSIVDLLCSRWGTTAPSPAGAVGVYAELPLPGSTPALLSRGARDTVRSSWAARTSLGTSSPLQPASRPVSA